MRQIIGILWQVAALLNCPMTRSLLGDVKTQVHRKHTEAVDGSPEGNVPKVFFGKELSSCSSVCRSPSNMWPLPRSAEEALNAAPGENQQQSAVTASPQKYSLRSPLYIFGQHCSQLVRKSNTSEQCESSDRLSESSYIKRAAAMHKQQTHPDVTQFFTCVCTSSCVTKGTDIEMIHYCRVSQLRLVGEL